MAFALPNPNTPTNGSLGDATPILQNEVAIAQAIAAFDGSQINAKSVVEAALADSINPRLRGSETLANFVFTGCIWSLVSGLSGTMTGGTNYVNGYRTVVSGVGSNTFTASNDTYVDVDYLGNVTYQGVANNASSPSLTANALRVAKIVTNGSTITAIIQVGADSLGNIIYPAGPASAVKMQNPYKFSVYRNAAWTTSNGTFGKVQFDAKTFDTGTNYDAVTNFRFTAPIAGFYLFASTVSLGTPLAGSGTQVALYKNGVLAKQGNAMVTGGATYNADLNVTGLLSLTVNDYVEVFAVGTNIAGTTGATATFFDGFLVSAT